ncbi:MAG: PEP-CTERM sorting domain-containing protein, partial [Pirellulales bacterium]
SSQAGKDKTGLGNFGALDDFNQASFRFADVFSLTLRYSDSDINALGAPSFREGALDYGVLFLAQDGVTLAAGTPISVFTDGWTNKTLVDNYLTRWMSPFAAIGMFVFGLTGDGHDGTAQIDAVIVAQQIPEPSTLVLVAFGTLGLVCRCRGRRTQ